MREYLTLAPAGLLELLEAMQGIRKHVTDTAGAVDHVLTYAIYSASASHRASVTSTSAGCMACHSSTRGRHYARS